ncbi:MAG: CotH kinase family protein [Bacteroidales bacterium]|nr:CotH kinase family protein [Bacteroidales bacterium]
MKIRNILWSSICLLAVSCTVQELDIVTTQTSAEHKVFYASFDSSEADTKVSLDENIKIFWDVDDRISIFNKSTLNQQYKFMGEEPANSGEFHWVSSEYFGAGNDLGYICAVYPYQKSTTISNQGVLTLTLPEEQTFREESFGPGANTMVSITDDGSLLRFKNVGGYLALKFYGEGVSVSSIRLVGNNGELLSGEATLKLPFGTEPKDPEIKMASTAGKSILLDCGEDGVELGNSDNPTIFWMVVPPTDFTDGFTLLVSDTNGDVFIKETHKHLTINRNGVLRISPIEVDMSSAGLSITKVESADQTKLPSTTEYDGRTITVTTPTLNRSNLVLDYTFTGESLKADGLDIIPGETPVNVTKPVTLTVRSGSHGKNYTLVGCNTGLPVVRITTKGFTLEDLQKYMNSLQNTDGATNDYPYGTDYRIWLPDDDGMVNLPDDNGKPSGDMVKGSVTVRIEYADGSPGLEIDKKATYEVKTQIKGRGNYTWKWDKKPYALKLEDKSKVLGMPKHKRWVLLANWRDHTLLRNDVTFELSRRAGLPYTVRGQFVELEFNGEYRGNYYLCEQIKIDEKRVNITPLEDNFTDLSGGYLMEIDSYWDEINKFHSKYFNLNYMFKEPDEDPAKEGTNPAYALGYKWMENYIAEFERVLKTQECVVKSGNAPGEYEDYLDVNSAISFMLVNELSGNRDFFQNGTHSGPHSTYLYKDKGGKIFMGPGWDFDYETYIPEDYYPKKNFWDSKGTYCWRGFDKTGYYYYYMCANSNFVRKVKQFWDANKESFLDLATDNTGYIDKMVNKIRLSEQFDDKKWPYHGEENRNDNYDYDGFTFQQAIDLMKTSLRARYNWMNERLNAENGTLTTTSPTNSQWTYRYKSQWPTN